MPIFKEVSTMLYRKKPVLVDAFQLTADAEIIAPGWCAQAVADGGIGFGRCLVDGHVHIYGCTVNTLEGRMHAKLGDYIIRGVKGELYPCKPDIFEKTYEPAQ